MNILNRNNKYSEAKVSSVCHGRKRVSTSTRWGWGGVGGVEGEREKQQFGEVFILLSRPKHNHCNISIVSTIPIFRCFRSTV